jgi:hypothetical protein
VTTSDGPVLATLEQRDAERQLLALLGDSDLQALQRQLAAEMAAMPTGQERDGAAQIDNAVAQWTNSMIFTEISSYQLSPAFLWATDNTPREWFGHSLGGAGIAGDNPDFIYRRLTVEGAEQFEITGRIDLAHRPAEMTMEAMRGNVGPMTLQNQSRGHADMGNQVAVIGGRDLKLDPDGSFRITLGGRPGDGNHLATEPGEITVLVRDVLSDWSQRPARISIRRLVDAGQPNDPADLKQRVLAKLPAYVRFWANYHTTWLGGLAPNSYAGPVARDGGWGFIAGLRFALAADEALLVTTTSGGAGYAGFQLTDPWMISPDRRRHQASLNLSQARPNIDGSYTYLVGPTDPGIANWIDSAGLRNGLALLRWQSVPAGADKDALIREFRVIKLSEAGLLDVPHVTAGERIAALARQAADYMARAGEG